MLSSTVNMTILDQIMGKVVCTQESRYTFSEDNMPLVYQIAAFIIIRAFELY